MAPSKVSAIRKIVNKVKEENRQRKVYMNSQACSSFTELRAMKRASIARRTAASSSNSSTADEVKSTISYSSSNNKSKKNTSKDRVTKPTTSKKTGSIGAGIITRVEQFETKAAKQANRLHTMDTEEDVVQSIEKHDSVLHDDNVASHRHASPASTLSSASRDSTTTLSPAPTPAPFQSLSPTPAVTPIPTHSTTGPSTTVSPAPAHSVTEKSDDSSDTITTIITITPASRPVRSSRAGAVAMVTCNPTPPSPNWVADAAEDPFGLFDDNEESDDDEWSRGVHRAG